MLLLIIPSSVLGLFFPSHLARTSPHCRVIRAIRVWGFDCMLSSIVPSVGHPPPPPLLSTGSLGHRFSSQRKQPKPSTLVFVAEGFSVKGPPNALDPETLQGSSGFPTRSGSALDGASSSATSKTPVHAEPSWSFGTFCLCTAGFARSGSPERSMQEPSRAEACDYG